MSTNTPLNTGRVGPITNWPLYVSVPVALLVVEFLNYWQHRWSHELNGGLGSFLWRSHATHHLPEQVYVLSIRRPTRSMVHRSRISDIAALVLSRRKSGNGVVVQ